MSLGNKIKEARIAKGWTQKELAQKSGQLNTSISNYETNLNVPSADAVAKLCKALGVSADYLLDVDSSEEFSGNHAMGYSQDVIDLIEQYNNRSEIKALFSLCRNASKDDVENAIKIMKMFKISVEGK